MKFKPKHASHSCYMKQLTCLPSFYAVPVVGFAPPSVCLSVRMGGSLWQPSPSAHHPFQNMGNSCQVSSESWLIITQTNY